MNKKELDKIEDFLECESFIQWVKQSDDSDNRLYWNEWILKNPEKKSLIESAIDIVKNIQFAYPRIDDHEVESALQKLNNRIDNRPVLGTKLSAHFRTLSKTWTIAASVVLLVSAGLWYSYDFFTQKEFITYFGEWKAIELPDGSEVKLSPNSKLTFCEKWKENETRKVWLKGEAFFKVIKMYDVSTSFKVITEDLGVEVLGTSFRVSTRGGQTEVYLQEGKVKLELNDENVTFMEPGEILTYSVEEEIIDRHLLNESQQPPDSWESEIISMDASAFKILQRIEETYGVKIEIRNKDLYQKRFNVQLPKKSLKIVIPILERTMKSKITHEENRLIFN